MISFCVGKPNETDLFTIHFYFIQAGSNFPFFEDNIDGPYLLNTKESTLKAGIREFLNNDSIPAEWDHAMFLTG